MPSRKITNRSVAAFAPENKDAYLWDDELSGFALKATAAGTRTFLVQYRLGGRKGRTRRVTIGKLGSPWRETYFDPAGNEQTRTVSLTPDTARREAKRILGEVAAGRDPAETKARTQADVTVAELCDVYLAEGVATKKASTVAMDRSRIESHVKPLLGRFRVSEVRRQHVERFLADVTAGKTARDKKLGHRRRSIVRGGKGVASRTLGMLGAIFEFSIGRGLRADNPVKGIRRFSDKKVERLLTSEELARLGQVLEEAEANNTVDPSAVNCVRLLALTGLRKHEALSLEWRQVDFGHGFLRLDDSKTGARIVPLGAPALALLDSLPRQEGNAFVFPGRKRGHHFVDGEIE